MTLSMPKLLEIIRHNESVDDNGDPVGAKPETSWEEGYAAGVRCLYRFLKTVRTDRPSASATQTVPPDAHIDSATSREWLVIEDSKKNGVFAPVEAQIPKGYIPRDVAEALLGRSMEATQFFTREESATLRAHPEWRNSFDDTGEK